MPPAELRATATFDVLRTASDRVRAAPCWRDKFSRHSSVVASIIGLLIAAVLLEGLITSGWSFVSEVLAPPHIEVEAYGLLPAAPRSNRVAMDFDGGRASEAVLVVLRSIHAKGVLAERVRVWAAPSQAHRAACASETLAVVFGDQTAAVLLPCSGPIVLGKIDVTVGKWSSPLYSGPPLAFLRWHRGSGEVRARLTNPFPQTTASALLVVGFFSRNGSIVGAGERSVPGLQVGKTQDTILPLQFGSDPAVAHAAVFEERA